MPHFPDDEPLSEIEELDSEDERDLRSAGDAPGRSARVYRQETIAGVLLLLAIVGLVGWQWWDQHNKQNAYESGVRAATAQNWAAARTSFLAAEGYRDSNQRAADAARMLAYTSALGGVVASRPNASPAGLYYFGSGGWHILQGSDLQSRVLATCPNGDLVYDGPWSGPGATPTPQPGRLPPRLVLAANRQGVVRARLDLLDTDLFNSYTCTDKGIWGERRIDAQSSLVDSHLLTPFFVLGYQDFSGAGEMAPVLLPGPNWTVTGLAPGEKGLLITQLSDVSTGDWHSTLYLTEGATATNPRKLADLPGLPGTDVPEAWGSSLLVTSYRPVAGTRDFTNTLTLVDTTGATPPRTLAEARVHAETFQDHIQMSTHLLSEGKVAGRVVITWPEEDHWVVRIADLAHPQVRPSTQVWRTWNGASPVAFLDSSPGDGGILLAQPGSINPGALYYVDGKGKANVYSAELPEGLTLAGGWIRGDYLVYAGTGPGPGGKEEFVVRALPRGGSQAKSLCEGPMPPVSPPVGPPWHAGKQLLACSYLGETNAFAYDGSSDSLLDTGSTAFSDYDLR